MDTTDKSNLVTVILGVILTIVLFAILSQTLSHVKQHAQPMTCQVIVQNFTLPPSPVHNAIGHSK